MTSATYRYPGIRPFQVHERSLFFGREKETKDLLSLLSAERTVVLFGPSGTGKSSLLNAGIIPALTELDKVCAISVRFGTYQKESDNSLIDIAIQIIRAKTNDASTPKWFKDLPKDENSLWYPLKKIQLVENNHSIVLIFDQAEEIFSFPQESIAIFKRQLAELQNLEVPKIIRDGLRDDFMTDKIALKEEEEQALFQPLNVKLLFAIRADRLSLLSSFADFLPNIFRWMYELKNLGAKQAREALIQPAMLEDNLFILPTFSYQDDTVNRIIDFLTKGKNSVEPFQLQIIANYIENIVIEGHTKVVTPEMLGDLENIYANYYMLKIASLPPTEQLHAKRLLEEGLIYEEEERRLSLYEGQILQQYDISPSLLEKLEASYLVRREGREGGGFFYEISHDTLIRPILKAKRERFEAEKLALEKQERIERRAQLEAAYRQTQEERERRTRAQRLSRFAVIISIIALILAIASVFSYQRANIAQKKANDAAVMAEIQEARAMSEKMAADTARIKADSSAAIAQTLSEQAKDAWQAAQRNLLLAKSEEAKAKNALQDMEQAKIASEVSRKEAEKNLKIAYAEKLKTKNALDTLAIKSNSLAASENALQSTISKQIERLKKNTTEAILNLEYESAYIQCMQLLELIQDPIGQDEQNLVQELAFYYKITDIEEDTRAKTLLDKIGISDHTFDGIADMSQSNFGLLKKRYFPELVPVTASLSAGKTEVTYWQYNIYIRATKQALPPATAWQITGNLPVVNVSWHDAIAYSNWLTIHENSKDFAYEIKDKKSITNVNTYSSAEWVLKLLWTAYKDRNVKILYNKSSKGYRLPTESEWKLMAGEFTRINDVAWYKGNSNGRTYPVGEKQNTQFGLMDIFGNALEWCWSDEYQTSFKERNLTQHFRDQVLLGGSWKSSVDECKKRIPSDPYNVSDTNGFRVVRSIQ